MSIRETLASMLGVRDDQTEDALADERRAREAVKLSRRGFFAAGAVMAAAPLVPTRAYGFIFRPAVNPLAPFTVHMLCAGVVGYALASGLVTLK